MPFDSLPEVPLVIDEVELTLRNARFYIERGWCKGQLHRNKHAEHCAVGAIRMATGWKTNSLFYRTVRRLADSLPGQYRRGPDRPDTRIVMGWNDRATRTKAEVLKQFDKVIYQS